MTELLEHVLVLGVSLLIPGPPLRHVLDHHDNDWFPATDSFKNTNNFIMFMLVIVMTVSETTARFDFK